MCANDTADPDALCTALCSFRGSSGNQLSGTFTLTLRRHTTTPIAFDATLMQFKAVVGALPNTGTINVPSS